MVAATTVTGHGRVALDGNTVVMVVVVAVVVTALTVKYIGGVDNDNDADGDGGGSFDE